MSKKYCLYHGGGCHDGLAAAWCFWTAWKNDCTYIPVNYNEPVPEMEEGSTIFIVDFCYSPNQIQELSNKHEGVLVIDHHVSAIRKIREFGLDKFNTNVKFIFDDTGTKSGALLAWSMYHPYEAPNIIKYISDYDTWQHNFPESIPYYHYIGAIAKTIELFDNVIQNDSHEDIMDIGGILADAEEEKIDWVIENTRRIIIFEGHYVPVVNCPHYMVSLTLDKLLKENPEYPFAIGYFDTDYGRKVRLCSRSSQEMDVSKLAEKWGGGGHTTAASFKIYRDKEAQEKAFPFYSDHVQEIASF